MKSRLSDMLKFVFRSFDTLPNDDKSKSPTASFVAVVVVVTSVVDDDEQGASP